MICEVCKQEIYGAVCDSYVVNVHEEENTFRHIDCNESQIVKNLELRLEKTKAQRDILKEIIENKLGKY